MTPRAFQVLKGLVAADLAIRGALGDTSEGPDLVCEGSVCYFGLERVRLSTVDQLIRCCAISESWSSGNYSAWAVNDTGRAIARRPELEAEVLAALPRGGAFTIQDDRLVSLEGEA